MPNKEDPYRNPPTIRIGILVQVVIWIENTLNRELSREQRFLIREIRDWREIDAGLVALGEFQSTDAFDTTDAKVELKDVLGLVRLCADLRSSRKSFPGTCDSQWSWRLQVLQILPLP